MTTTPDANKDADNRELESWWKHAMAEAGLVDFKIFPADIKTSVSEAVREILAVIKDGHKSAVTIKSDADF